MTLDTSAHVELKAANEAFRSKDFRKALETYNRLVKDHTRLQPTLAVNIELCRRRIAEVAEVDKKSFRTRLDISSDVRQLLRTPIIPKVRMPRAQIVFDFLSECGQPARSKDHFHRGLVCAASSPFQRDLLFYIGFVAKSLHLDIREFAYSPGGVPNLAFMLYFASDHTFWLLNRARFSRFLHGQGVRDPRAQDLFNQRPIPDDIYQQMLPADSPLSDVHQRWAFRGELSGTSEALGARQPEWLHAGTIVLNEEHYIARNLIQHYEVVDSWTLVEGLCRGYPERNARGNGLSGDRTAMMIRLFPDSENKIRYIAHGKTTAVGEDAKSELRNRYLDCPHDGILLVIDADEFYHPSHIEPAKQKITKEDFLSVTLPQVHLWKNHRQFITGGYYDVSHTRFFRNIQGMRYQSNHNFPELNGRLLVEERRFKFERIINKSSKHDAYRWQAPYVCHLGFAKPEADMKDKTEYYVNRGEDSTRPETTQCRAAWFSNELPDGCKVRNWEGDLPSALNLQVRGSEI